MNKDKDIEQSNQLIGYEPNFTYTDEYWSEIEESDKDKDGSLHFGRGDKETINNLLNNLHDLDFAVSKLPKPFSDAIKEVLDPVLDFAEEELGGKEYNQNINTDNDWIYDDYPPRGDEGNDGNGDGSGSGDDWPDDGINGDDDSGNNEAGEGGSSSGEGSGDSMWGSNDFFPTIEIEDKKENIYEKEYIKNLTELLDFYYRENQNAVMQFWRDYIISTSKKAQNEVQFMLDDMNFKSSYVHKDSKHLFDHAYRQNTCKAMKLDYHLLVYNAEETIVYLKQFKAMQETRLRYSKIDELDGSKRAENYSNKVLNASLIAYNKKYDIAFSNLYRYLHSSNKVMKDCFQTWIQEIKSKQILIERKGISKD